MITIDKNRNKKVSPVVKFTIWFFTIIIIGLGFYGIYWYVQTTTYVSMDDGKISSDILNVTPKVSGSVIDVKVKPGEKVKSGDILFVIDSQQLQIQLNQAEAALDVAKTQLSKVVEKATDKDIQISEDQVKIAQANYDLAKLNFDNANVKATIDGVVAQVNVIPGATVAPTVAAVSIIDTSKVQIIGNVNEDKITKVKIGQTVNINIDAVPEIFFSGKVSEVGLATSSAISPYSTEISFSSSSTTVNLPVKIDFDTQGKDIKPGMSAKANIKIK